MERLGEGDSPAMTFEVGRNEGGTATVTVGGDLDISNVERLEEAVAPVIASKPDRLVVNINELRFADSSAIAVWVRWASAVGRVELRDASPLLRQVITKMGLAEKLQLN
jgi:anti-anti-sigma factor